MIAEVLRVEDGTALVEVYDRAANRHLVEVDVETGDLGRHGQDAYPGPDSPDRTEEHDRIVERVDARAQYEVHTATEHDVLDPGWVPEQLERGIEALDAASTGTLRTAFEDYYRLLTDPEAAARKYDLAATGRVTDPRVTMILKAFCIDDDDTIVDVPEGEFLYYTGPDVDVQYEAGVSPTCPDGTTRIPVTTPPMGDPHEDFEYPEDLRVAMQRNLACQIRDVYRNVGEEVPPEYDLEGFGKPNVDSGPGPR